MENRRQFIKKLSGLFSGATILSGLLPPFLKSLYGKQADVMLAGGYMDKSGMKNSYSRRVHVTPLDSFGVMGKTDINIKSEEWHLEIRNKEKNLINYTYDEILNLPVIEKKAVLTCPGFFENHGLWKGFSLGSILREKGLLNDVKKIEISGLNGRKDMSIKFPLKSILNDRVFPAYGVNREILPMRNGFPLRVVAQEYSGSRWIKYVNKITLI